jgi:hypothetical protein
MRRPEPIAGLCQGAALQLIQTRIEKHRQVLDAARKALPKFLADHCTDCVTKPDRLILYADSPAWAAQIRFYAPHILSMVQQSTGHRFQDLVIRNTFPVATKPPHNPVVISSPGFVAEVLKDSALSSPSGELKDALLRLSETVRTLGSPDS